MNNIDEYVLNHINDLDIDEWLNNYTFKEETLEKLLGFCKLRKIVYTQKVSKEFIQKYIIDTDAYQTDDGDSTISFKTIERCQGYKFTNTQ
jgi:hypothetical protein